MAATPDPRLANMDEQMALPRQNGELVFAAPWEARAFGLAVALNEAGETIGIIDAVEGSEATIVPVSLVRSAVKRVIARQASVPRPWLGVHGEPVRSLSLERILGIGWEPERARELRRVSCRSRETTSR